MITLLSSTMAKRLPTFLEVISPKVMAPRVSNWKLTTERPVCWSKPGCALVSDFTAELDVLVEQFGAAARALGTIM
ncbi:MAG: hypothetical protein QM702_10655 [Rubrivivax sp.]